MRTLKQSKLNLDKLEICYCMDNTITDTIQPLDRVEFDSFHLLKSRYVDDYKCCYEIRFDYNDDVFGWLYWGSYRIGREGIYILINNHILYSNDDKHCLYYIAESIGLQFLKVSKLDIALDFNFNAVNKITEVLKNPQHRICVKDRQVKDSDEFMTVYFKATRYGLNKASKSLYIEYKDDVLSLKVYNKRKEIEDNDNEKQYILDDLGYGNKDVYRAEISVRHKHLMTTLLKLKENNQLMNFNENDNVDEYLYYHIYNEIAIKKLYFDLLHRIIHINKNSLLEYIM